jgi:hypothetical protein
MKRRLIGAALGGVLSTNAAHAVEVINLHSIVAVTDPSNGEQFRLSPQAYAPPSKGRYRRRG